MSLYAFSTGREVAILVPLASNSPIELANGGENGATVVALRIAEVAAATPNVTLDIFDGTNVLAKIAHQRVFTAKEVWLPVELSGAPVVLLKGQSLRATASAGNQLHCTGVLIRQPQRV